MLRRYGGKFVHSRINCRQVRFAGFQPINRVGNIGAGLRLIQFSQVICYDAIQVIRGRQSLNYKRAIIRNVMGRQAVSVKCQNADWRIRAHFFPQGGQQAKGMR